jgi:hypothetical protein
MQAAHKTRKPNIPRKSIQHPNRFVNGVSVQRRLGIFVQGSQCQRPTQGHLLLDPEGKQSLVDMGRTLVEQPRSWLQCLLALLQPLVGLSGWLTV